MVIIALTVKRMGLLCQDRMCRMRECVVTLYGLHVGLVNVCELGLHVGLVDVCVS